MIDVDMLIWINQTLYQNEKSTNAAQHDDKHNVAQDDDNLKKQNKNRKKSG
jgi:hypothetical protein